MPTRPTRLACFARVVAIGEDPPDQLIDACLEIGQQGADIFGDLVDIGAASWDGHVVHNHY